MKKLQRQAVAADRGANERNERLRVPDVIMHERGADLGRRRMVERGLALEPFGLRRLDEMCLAAVLGSPFVVVDQMREGGARPAPVGAEPSVGHADHRPSSRHEFCRHGLKEGDRIFQVLEDVVGNEELEGLVRKSAQCLSVAKVMRLGQWLAAGFVVEPGP